MDKEVAEASGTTLKDLVPTGTCVLIEGVLSKTPEGTKQAVELKASRTLAEPLCSDVWVWGGNEGP